MQNQENTSANLHTAYEGAGGQSVTAKLEVVIPLKAGETIMDAMDTLRAIKSNVEQSGCSVTGQLALGRSKFPI